MSFLGGAECSTGSNPLSQFAKHVQDDKTTQQDRLVGPAGRLSQALRSQNMPAGAEHMIDDFIQHSGAGPLVGPAQADPFMMDQLRRDLTQAGRMGGPMAGPGFYDVGLADKSFSGLPASQNALNRHAPAGLSPAEFAKFQTESAAGPSAGAMGVSRPMVGPMSGYRPMGYSGLQYGQTMGNMGMVTPASAAAVNAGGLDKGKERADADWEAHFADLEREQTENQPVEKTDVRPDADRFDAVWDGLRAESEIGRSLAEEDDLLDGIDSWDAFEAVGNTGMLQDPNMGNYTFEDADLFDSATDPYAEGVQIVDAGGNLTMAALAFEAAVQRQPDHVDAWVRLGTTQAQNENETAAIRALEQAIRLDENNLEALLALAVSYTNEGYDSSAYRTLERWVASKYPAVITEPLDQGADAGFTDRLRFHRKVIDLFIAAAQLSPSGDQMDPDVQVGLGVLFYGADEYEKAVDCFSAALASTEHGTMNGASKLHLLWNRLGATLANSGKSEEAIGAYEKALELRPNFVRAIYNLGVSCINIGCHREAAQYLLSALSMQQDVAKAGREKAKELLESARAGAGPAVTDEDVDRVVWQNQSANVYDNLRRVFGCLDRRDLADLVGPGMDLGRFRQEFDF